MMKQVPEQVRIVLAAVMADPVPPSVISRSAKATTSRQAQVQEANFDIHLERSPKRLVGVWHGFSRCLMLGAFLAGQVLGAAAEENGCIPIPLERLTTLQLNWYSTPPVRGGIPVPVELKVDGAYIYKPIFALGGPSGSTALFQMNFRSGQPVTYSEQAKPMEPGELRVLIAAYGYSRPEYSLGAWSGAPTGLPLTWPEYHRTGKSIQGFWEIRVEDASEYHLQNTELAAEFGADDHMTALLSCEQIPGARNRSCRLKESVDGFDTSSTFLWDDLGDLPTIRQRISQFISCAKGRE